MLMAEERQNVLKWLLLVFVLPVSFFTVLGYYFGEMGGMSVVNMPVTHKGEGLLTFDSSERDLISIDAGGPLTINISSWSPFILISDDQEYSPDEVIVPLAAQQDYFGNRTVFSLTQEVVLGDFQVIYTADDRIYFQLVGMGALSVTLSRSDYFLPIGSHEVFSITILSALLGFGVGGLISILLMVRYTKASGP
jgi:hypothetical protein